MAEHYGVLDACAVLLTTGGKEMEVLLKSQCTIDMLQEMDYEENEQVRVDDGWIDRWRFD